MLFPNQSNMKIGECHHQSGTATCSSSEIAQLDVSCCRFTIYVGYDPDFGMKCGENPRVIGWFRSRVLFLQKGTVSKALKSEGNVRSWR
jgi:hypothetical protein